MRIIYTILFTTSLLTAGTIDPIPLTVTYDKEKVALGRMLFFDPLLSEGGEVSCASCHGHFGADKRAFSLGHKGQLGTMNTPTVFNVVYNFAFFWNGRSRNLEEQLVEPVQNSFEMHSTPEIIEKRLNASPTYRSRFKAVYKKAPDFTLVQDALVAFEKTLLTPNARFDRYLRGELALSEREMKGYGYFKDYGCISCHNGINVGGNSYQKFGNVIPLQNTTSGQWTDLYTLTRDPDDKKLFRVPGLRNVTRTAPYFHDASAPTLEDAVHTMGYHNLGIDLSDDEIAAIIAFLKTLEGEIPETWEAR